MDLQTIIKDPDYLGLPDGEKAKVVNYMLQRDDDFKGLPDTEQGKVRQYFIKGIAPEPKTPIQILAQWDYTGIDNRIAPATEAQKAQVKGGYQSILKPVIPAISTAAGYAEQLTPPEPIDPKLQGMEVLNQLPKRDIPKEIKTIGKGMGSALVTIPTETVSGFIRERAEEDNTWFKKTFQS